MKRSVSKLMVLVLFCACVHTTAVNAQPENPVPCECTLGVCNGNIAIHNYSGIAGWGSSITTPGSMSIANGVMNYVSTPGANYNRMIGGLNALVNNSLNFIAECRINITGGNAPGHYVMAITENSNDPISTNTAGYPLTNNDMIAVTLIKEGSGPGNATCCTNPCLSGNRWLFQIASKDGASAPVFSSGGIPVQCPLPVTYYVRLVRSDCWTYLGVYTDPGFTNHIPGSPVCQIIPGNINNLRRLQHGVITWSSAQRTLSMTLDDTRVCTYTTGCSTIGCNQFAKGTINAGTVNEIIPGDAEKQHIIVVPNPAVGFFKVNLSKVDEQISSIAVYDITGKIYKLVKNMNNNAAITIDGNDLPNGAFIIEAYGQTKSWKSHILIKKP